VANPGEAARACAALGAIARSGPFMAVQSDGEPLLPQPGGFEGLLPRAKAIDPDDLAAVH
jgi:hypothetical protein